MLLSVLHVSNLGNIYSAEKTGLVYKMAANSKLSLRDEGHIASHSLCCLGCVVTVLGQFGAACVSYVRSVKKGG